MTMWCWLMVAGLFAAMAYAVRCGCSKDGQASCKPPTIPDGDPADWPEDGMEATMDYDGAGKKRGKKE